MAATVKVTGKMISRGIKRYPVFCCLVVASLIGFLLTLAIAAWELNIGLIAYNMSHVHDKKNMYYNDGTQLFLKYSGITYFIILTLLSIASLKNAFDFICLMLDRESSWIFAKLPSVGRYRDKLEKFYVKRIEGKGYALIKKEDKVAPVLVES